MKRSILMRAAVGLFLLLSVGPFVASGQPKGETVTIKGEVVDLWCYLEGGNHGAEHKACGVTCAKAGNPIGILTDKGEVYVVMGMEDHQPGRDVLINKMAEAVMVEGTLVKKGGTQVIYVSKVK